MPERWLNPAFACKYARAQDFPGKLAVSLETQSGEILARQFIKGIGTGWKQFETDLKPDKSNADAWLVIAVGESSGTARFDSLEKPMTLWLDMVSLFPRGTWNNRGLRPDLAQKMADMKLGLVSDRLDTKKLHDERGGVMAPIG